MSLAVKYRELQFHTGVDRASELTLHQILEELILNLKQLMQWFLPLKAIVSFSFILAPSSYLTLIIQHNFILQKKEVFGSY